MATPHKCPVCYGRCSIADYSRINELSGTTATFSPLKVACPACRGTGTVWEPEDIEFVVPTATGG